MEKWHTRTNLSLLKEKRDHWAPLETAENLVDVEAEIQLNQVEARFTLNPLLENLNGSERQVLELHFVEGVSLKAIGKELGIKKKEVIAIGNQAFSKMQSNLRMRERSVTKNKR